MKVLRNVFVLLHASLRKKDWWNDCCQGTITTTHLLPESGGVNLSESRLFISWALLWHVYCLFFLKKKNEQIGPESVYIDFLSSTESPWRKGLHKFDFGPKLFINFIYPNWLRETIIQSSWEEFPNKMLINAKQQNASDHNSSRRWIDLSMSQVFH